MNPSAFYKIFHNFQRIMRKKSLKEIELMENVLSATTFMAPDQISLLIQELSALRNLKKPRSREEFNRIMKGFFK